MPVLGLIKRELIAQLRQRKTLVLLLLLMVPMVVMTVGLWPDEHSAWVTIGFSSRSYIAMVMLFLFAGAALFMPGVAATTLVLEREQNSWDMLYMTQLSPWGIIFGKLLSVVGVFAILVIAVAPLLFAVLFMVGVDMRQIAVSLYFIFLTMLTCASMGMLCSAYCRTTTRAISRSYSLMVLNMGLAYALFALVWYAIRTFMMYQSSGAANFMFESSFTLQSTSYMTLPMMYRTVASGTVPGIAPGDDLIRHTVMQMTVIVLCLVMVRRKIAKPISPPVVKKRAHGVGARAQEGAALPLPPGFKPVPKRMNPILFRETRWGIDVRKRIYIGHVILLLTLAIIMGTLHFREDLGVHDIIMTLVVTNLILVSLYVTANLANIFTKEDELKNHDMLKMTLMTSRQIVNGKLRAGIRVLNRFMVSSFLISSVFLLPVGFEHNEPQSTYLDAVCALFIGHWMLWLCGVFCVLLAGLASVLAKRTTTAIISAYFCVGMLYMGNWIIVELLRSSWVASFRFMQNIPRHYFAGASPVNAYLDLMDFSDLDRYSYEFVLLTVTYVSLAVVLYLAIPILFRIKQTKPGALVRE